MCSKIYFHFDSSRSQLEIWAHHRTNTTRRSLFLLCIFTYFLFSDLSIFFITSVCSWYLVLTQVFPTNLSSVVVVIQFRELQSCLCAWIRFWFTYKSINIKVKNKKEIWYTFGIVSWVLLPRVPWGDPVETFCRCPWTCRWICRAWAVPLWRSWGCPEG